MRRGLDVVRAAQSTSDDQDRVFAFAILTVGPSDGTATTGNNNVRFEEQGAFEASESF